MPNDGGFHFSYYYGLKKKKSKGMSCVSGSTKLSGRSFIKWRSKSQIMSVYSAIIYFPCIVYSYLLFACPSPYIVHFPFFTLALCVQWSRADTSSFTFNFKVQPNDQNYIFVILVIVLVSYVDYLK